MKETRIVAALAALILFNVLIGCASQPTPRSEITSCPSVLRTEPLLVASTAPVELSAEEEALLEDDWDTEDEELYTVADPLEGFNRAMFYVNDKLYFWLLKPVARGYRTVVAQDIRIGVKNFFTNITAPIRMVNCLLQGKGKAAGAEVAKFFINSTAGVLGFGDPAQNYPELNPDPEDLGQTFGRYGIGDGFYIVWPILGPTTLRDTIGATGDFFLNPINYVEPYEASLALSSTDRINNISFRIGDYETIKKGSLDPYMAVRNGYIQLRQSKIKK